MMTARERLERYVHSKGVLYEMLLVDGRTLITEDKYYETYSLTGSASRSDLRSMFELLNLRTEDAGHRFIGVYGAPLPLDNIGAVVQFHLVNLQHVVDITPYQL